MSERLFNGKPLDQLDSDEATEYAVSDDYDAVLPVTIDSRNTDYYIIDGDGVVVAGPMGCSCAERVCHNINRAMPSELPPLLEIDRVAAWKAPADGEPR